MAVHKSDSKVAKSKAKRQARGPQKASPTTILGSFNKQFRFIGPKEMMLVSDVCYAKWTSRAKGRMDVDTGKNDVVGRLIHDGSDVRRFELRLWKGIGEQQDPRPDIQGVLTMLEMICHYVNTQTPSISGIPQVFAASFLTAQYFLTKRSRRTVLNDLTNSGITPEIFYTIKRILIPVTIKTADGDIDDHTGEIRDDHVALIVISPYYRTIDYLNSSETPKRRSGEEGQIFENTLSILASHLGDEFIPSEWRIRRNKAVLQEWHDTRCTAFVVTNAMCVAFGYPLDYAELQFDRKVNRIPSELLHGGFDKYEGTDFDDVARFAYQFGDHDDRADPTRGFVPIEDYILNTLLEQVRNRVAARSPAKPIAIIPNISAPKINSGPKAANTPCQTSKKISKPEHTFNQEPTIQKEANDKPVAVVIQKIREARPRTIRTKKELVFVLSGRPELFPLIDYVLQYIMLPCFGLSFHASILFVKKVEAALEIGALDPGLVSLLIRERKEVRDEANAK